MLIPMIIPPNLDCMILAFPFMGLFANGACKMAHHFQQNLQEKLSQSFVSQELCNTPA